METISLKALAQAVLAGNCKETSLKKEETFEETFSQKFPKKFPNSVTRIEQNCQGCPYHDTGPDSFGKGRIHWCGPWRDAIGDIHWFNIEKLKACPKGEWGTEVEILEDFGARCSDVGEDI